MQPSSRPLRGATQSRQALCVPLALLLALPATSHASAPETAQPPPSEATFYEKVDQAEAAAGIGKLGVAGDLYVEAYDSLDDAGRASESASDVVREAVSAYRDRFFAVPTDPTPLERARGLLERHLEDLARQGAAQEKSATFQSQLASVKSLLAVEAEKAAPKPEPQPHASQPVATGPQPSAAPDDRDGRKLVIGLGTGGAIGLAGGIALLAYGAWFRSNTANIHESQVAMTQPCSETETKRCEQDAWRDRENKKANAVLGAGGALAAVGLGLGIAAIVVHVRDKRQTRTTASPVVGPGFAGLALRAQF